MIQDEFSTVVDSAAYKATGFCFEDYFRENINGVLAALRKVQSKEGIL